MIKSRRIGTSSRIENIVMFNRMATNFEVTHCETSATYKWKYLNPPAFQPPDAYRGTTMQL